MESIEDDGENDDDDVEGDNGDEINDNDDVRVDMVFIATTTKNKKNSISN